MEFIVALGLLMLGSGMVFRGYRAKSVSVSVPGLAPEPEGLPATRGRGTVTITDVDTVDPDNIEDIERNDSEAIRYMAMTIWGEARGESDAGQEAVGWVIRNRMKSPRYPDTIKGVVTQGGGSQFNVWQASDPNYNRMQAVTVADPAYAKARSIAIRVIASLDRQDPTKGALHYLNPKTASSYWTKAFRDGADEIIAIGNHEFFTGLT